MYTIDIDIGAHLTHETPQPKHLEGTNTTEGLLEPTVSISPIRRVYISKKKWHKLAAAAASGTPLTAPLKTSPSNAKDKTIEFNQENALRDMGITSLELVDSTAVWFDRPHIGRLGMPTARIMAHRLGE